MMIISAILTVLSFSVLHAFQVAPSNFASGDLRRDLQQEARQGHRAIGYDSARREIMGRIDLEQVGRGYAIKDVYCEKVFDADDFSRGQAPGPGQVPPHQVINIEHTWPQSKFAGGEQGTMKSDLHHLFPSDTEMNSSRGSYPFGVVFRETDTLKCNCSKLGRSANGETVFEPPMGHRGNVARALFYFSVRYGIKIDPQQENVLREWHEQDPVDAKDVYRNDEIEKTQGNRNPFIDNPQLVGAITDF